MNAGNKVIAFCLCSAVVFSLTGCNPASSKSLEVMDSGDFEDVLEDLDYDVTEDIDYLNEGQETAAYAYDEDDNYFIFFMQYEDEAGAVDDFNDMYDDLKEAKDNADFDGSYIKTTGKN